MTGFFKGLLVGLGSFGLGLAVLSVVLPPDLRVSVDPVSRAPAPEAGIPPEATPQTAPEAVPEAVSDAVPRFTVQAVPETAPETTPEAALDAASDAAPETTLEAAPEVTPEATAETTPEAAPEAAPETAVEPTAAPAPAPQTPAPPQVAPAEVALAPVAEPAAQAPLEAPAGAASEAVVATSAAPSAEAPADAPPGSLGETGPGAGALVPPLAASDTAPDVPAADAALAASADATALAAPEAPRASAPADPAPSAEIPAADAPAAPVLITEPAPMPAPSGEAPAAPEPRILRAVPSTLLDRQVEGVVTGRLPRIGAEAPADPAPQAPEAAPQTAADLPALLRHAAAFDASADLPRLSVILIDAPGTEEALVALPFALTIAVDPDLPGADLRARLYRQAGHEVALLARGLPPGATASDLAVTFGEWLRILPEAVVLIDAPEGGGLTGDRLLAQAVMPYLSEQGLGLITPALGLNQAAQVAQAAGVPQASIFRGIDTGDEAEPAIRRFLTRAAFEAQSQGQAVVLGRAEHAPTLAALIGWRLEMRARQVALAPVSALLGAAPAP